jgi:hypothetical protein
MKRLIIMALLCGGCLTDATLNVRRGSGSGTYTLGTTVAIVADAPAPTEAFQEWRGDISGLLEPMKTNTTILMNQRAKTIEATFKQVTPPEPVYEYITGNKLLDGGREMWGNVGSMGLRFDANDKSKTPEVKNPFYFLDGDMVTQLGAQTWERIGDNWVFTAKDFVSPRSGLHYRFMGWTKYYSASPLIPDHVISIPVNQLHDVLRSYWGTYEP